jgi:hypothetical protein
MPIPDPHTKERISVVYAMAIAARAGVSFNPKGIPEYGTDAYFAHVNMLKDGSFSDTGYILNCQLKSTTDYSINNGEVIYDIESEAYNKLVTWEGTTPIILVLLCLPKEIKEWMEFDESQLILRKCCYWMIVTGEPTTNSSSIRIRIPRGQCFTPEALLELFVKIRLGEI